MAKSRNDPDWLLRQRIAALRIEAGFPTQEALALHLLEGDYLERLDWKTSPMQRIQAMESGPRRLKHKELLVLAEVFGPVGNYGDWLNEGTGIGGRPVRIQGVRAEATARARAEAGKPD